MTKPRRWYHRFLIKSGNITSLFFFIVIVTACSQIASTDVDKLNEHNEIQPTEIQEVRIENITPEEEKTQQPNATVIPTSDGRIVLPAADLTLWHAYKTGSNELFVLTELINKITQYSPGLNINIIQVPSGEMISDYTYEVLNGEGPDILLTNNIDISKLARNALILNLDQFDLDWLDDFDSTSLAGMKVDGNLYGIPLATNVLAIYYKKNIVGAPPKTTDELLALVESDRKLTQVLNSFFLFGWGRAFGGKVVSNNDNCTANKAEWLDTVNYLKLLEMAGATYKIDYRDAVESFVSGDTAMFIDGSWVLDEYKEKLGGNLGVVIMPKGPSEYASPYIISDGFYLNPNSTNAQVSLLLIKYLSSRESLNKFTNNAYLVPSRTDVETLSDEVEEFKTAVNYGTLYPQNEMFTILWVSFDNMFKDVLIGGISPEEAIDNMCVQIEELNQELP